jgi:hypothetical protein
LVQAHHRAPPCQPPCCLPTNIKCHCTKIYSLGDL